ncbi:hypothetical protein [Solimonas marina]|uniref:Uncharacterized protein n=1 Tax=Solimonas marina TaxID=2714601 RepID=A0A969WB21_9GAMM|nr:hypothetical protein [Solimonas marina]NKF22879.1 hypothetical protein [Solimonas marina]
MRRTNSLRLLLLTLGLVLGQWLALAHDFEHPALQADTTCQICAHAQGLSGGALAPGLHLPAVFAVGETPTTTTAVLFDLAPRGQLRIRGPPATTVSTI